MRNDLIGFNHLFDDFFKDRPGDTFPPFNLYESDTGVVLELALAGYTRDRISVVYDQKDQTLIISASPEIKPTLATETSAKGKEIYKKIASRPFIRKFLTDGKHEVTSAELKDGLLTVVLTEKIDPKKEPIKIAIS